MKFGIVTFPGSNCDQDMHHVLRNVLNQDTVSLWHKDVDLQNCDVIVLPGGFSYGDYLRSGAIAKFSKIMNSIINFANRGGFVIGICNGFQILCESKLLPGALLHNDSHKFICKNTYLSVTSNSSRFTSKYSLNQVIKIPVAHAEGRYHADENTLNSLKENDQIIFQYCNVNGKIDIGSNINGSALNIAGICNINRNVFGMMPHPERASDSELSNTDGINFFLSAVESST
ncbi:phosphoribosylformylglycinamidine synthase subunit PurQ [Bacteroidota bacterium]|nr:phosphoribosylformylglycinamidine synthase subunit PurQ [Bacteroidota bacterium]